MNSKQKKPVVKVTVALISIFGITAIGVGSALAIANKDQAQEAKSSYEQTIVKCKAYKDSDREEWVKSVEISIARCERRNRLQYEGLYWSY